MEFLVMCPNDGAVEVGLEDIGTIVVRGDEAVDVIFACPRCGHHIKVSAEVPRVLLSTLADAVVVDDETGEATLSVNALIERGHLLADTGGQFVTPSAPATDAETGIEDHIDDYCEYFRRQLAEVSSVESVLAEIDSE